MWQVTNCVAGNELCDRQLVGWWLKTRNWIQTSGSEVHLIEFKFCEDTRPDPQLQKAKAQHSVLIANLNRQGCREVELHLILVGVKGTIYKDYTDKPLLWQTLIWVTIRLKTWHPNWMNIHQTCICTHKNKVCTAIKHKQQQSRFGSWCYGTQPPWPTLISFKLFARWGVAWHGHLCSPLPWSCWLCHHYQRSLFFFLVDGWEFLIVLFDRLPGCASLLMIIYIFFFFPPLV